MKKIISVSALILLLVCIGCGSNPYAKTNRAHKKHSKILAQQLRDFPPEKEDRIDSLNYGKYWVGTTNFSLRKPNYVIIHHTAQDSVEHTLKTFTLPRTQVSAHYVISDDGEVYHMLNDYYRAWHAGVGKWGNNSDLNSSSIGIELDNNGHEPFSPAQIESLLRLLSVLKEKYNIPAANFIGHSDIAPTRKVDPNANFPWELLAEEGYGLWYDEDIIKEQPIRNQEGLIVADTTETAVLFAMEKPGVKDSTVKKPPVITPEIALRIIGYNTSDLDAAIRAFKLHFIPGNVNSNLTQRDLNILYNLYKKYL